MMIFLLSRNCLKNMLHEFKKLEKQKVAVGPMYFDDNRKLHYNYKNENFFSSLIKYIFVMHLYIQKKLKKSLQLVLRI